MKNKILGFVGVSVLVLGITVSAYSASPIKLIINGTDMILDVQPSLVGGRVLAPVRAVAEALGATVNWDGQTQSVIINSSSESRTSRLEDALAPNDSLTAVTRWAEGVKTRNGALQYAVMSPELKKEKYSEFAEMNWSTGVSSPWVESYTITQKNKLDENTYIYRGEFTYTDSTKSTFKEQVNVTVNKFEYSWLVSSIEKIDVSGGITKMNLDQNKNISSIFIDSKSPKIGYHDKATLVINEKTKIYKGYTNELLKVSDLKEGLNIEAEFGGPVLMMYPVQGGAKVIRVIE